MRAYFFSPESPRPLALLRMVLGLVFLYDFGVRWPYAVELYSADGFSMPVFPPELFPGTPFAPAPLSAAWTVALHSLLLFSLLAVTAGWRTRSSLWIALTISLWLGLLDQAGTFKKYSVIGLHLMLLLSFTQCGSCWSVDAFLGRAKRICCPLSPAWPRRLMQVLVAAVYFGGAVTKIRLPDFANGDLLMFSLLDDQWGGATLGHWLSTRPNLLILASTGTVLLEIAFPFLLWNARLRRPALCLAAAFHLALAAAMHLGIFPFVMLAALLTFVEEKDLRLLRGTAAAPPPANMEKPGRREWFSFAAWFAAAASIAIAGVAVHDWADGGHRAVVFQPVDEETQQRMLASLTPAQKTSYADYFHRVELGNRLSADGTHALGSDSRFERGMTVYACARLLQRHPALRIEWILVRPDAEDVRYGYELAATVSHATVGFALTDPDQTPPGEYRLVLRADGHEVATRGFVLEER